MSCSNSCSDSVAKNGFYGLAEVLSGDVLTRDVSVHWPLTQANATNLTFQRRALKLRSIHCFGIREGRTIVSLWPAHGTSNQTSSKSCWLFGRSYHRMTCWACCLTITAQHKEDSVSSGDMVSHRGHHRMSGFTGTWPNSFLLWSNCSNSGLNFTGKSVYRSCN